MPYNYKIFEIGIYVIDPSISFQERLAKGGFDYVNPAITEGGSCLHEKVCRRYGLVVPECEPTFLEVPHVGSVALPQFVSTEGILSVIVGSQGCPANIDDAMELGGKHFKGRKSWAFLGGPVIRDDVDCLPVIHRWGKELHLDTAPIAIGKETTGWWNIEFFRFPFFFDYSLVM